MIANSNAALYENMNNVPSWKREEDAVRRYWEVITRSNPNYRKQRKNKSRSQKNSKEYIKNKDYYELSEKYEHLYKEIKKYKIKWFDNWESNKDKEVEYQTETHQLREKIMDFVYDWYILMIKYKNPDAKKYKTIYEKLLKIKSLSLSLIDIRDLIKIRYNLRINETFGNISEEKKKEIDSLVTKYINSLRDNLGDYLADREPKLTRLYLPPYSVIRSRKLIWFIDKNKKYRKNEILFIGENGEKIELFNSEERLTYALCVEMSKRIKKWGKKSSTNNFVT